MLMKKSEIVKYATAVSFTPQYLCCVVGADSGPRELLLGESCYEYKKALLKSWMLISNLLSLITLA